MPETWRRLCLSWGVLPLLAPAAAAEEALTAARVSKGQQPVS